MSSPMFEAQEVEMKIKTYYSPSLCSYMKKSAKMYTSLYNRHSEKSETHTALPKYTLKSRKHINKPCSNSKQQHYADYIMLTMYIT